MKVDQIVVPKFERGSEWRRWDLHVHTPMSKLGSSFAGVDWNSYVDALEDAAKTDQIAVIGVTDYMSIDGYERLLIDKAENERLHTVELLIPNIELRAQPATKDGKALNIHLLIDPSDEEHVSKIKKALRNLRVDYTTKEGKHTYGCVREELIEFARVQKPELTDEEQAYKFGIEQFKPTYKAIWEWIDAEGWLKANCLIGISNGKDGISGLPPDGFAAVRDDLLRHSQFIFSGNPLDRQYYLGQKKGIPATEIVRMYGGLKPCLHGSDAHDLPKLFKPDEDRKCWVKADPTFEGLRQTLWEPGARVHIGASMPQLADQSRVIREIRISNSQGWFAQARLTLSSGLVAVIGEKGAGKTAIADLIAFASGVPEDSSSQSSFIKKGRLHLNGLAATVEWGSGTTSSGTLTSAPYKCQKPLVRYLSQDFVERLCSDDHEGYELQSAIEEVVFAHLDEIQREGYSSFEELRAAREAASHSRQADVRGQIASLNQEIERLQASLAQRAAKVASVEQVNAQLVELRKQLPSVTSAADEAVLTALTSEKEKLKKIEEEVSKKSRQKRNAEEFLKSYVDLRVRVEKQLRELIDAGQLSELADEETLRSLFPSWNDGVEATIAGVLEKLANDVSALTGPRKDENDTSLHGLTSKIRELEQALAKDEVNRRRLVDLQKQIGVCENSITRLTKEISDLDSKTKKLLDRKREDRDEAYLKYFEAIAEDERGLRDLYAPMKERLDRLGSEMKFELSTGYRVSAREWLDKSARFFDGRKSTALSKKEAIERHLTKVLAPAWNSGEREKVRVAIEKLEELVAPAEFIEKLASPTVKMIDLLDWMYSTDHIQTTYKIHYGGTSLEHLSPGTRGIALLVLYLLMDDDDSRPLIIDQPEGNLDNSSIYLQLVPYLREAKLKRQIILVTHNPNLVVATDAEQIIIATSARLTTQPFPRMTYISGPLEHSVVDDGKLGIRQAVCTLLEGGDRAFKEREGRYSIRR